MMNEATNIFYEFDSFQVDVRRRLLMREGQVVPLTSKVFEILLTLIRSQGRVISKDEMMNLVWPDCFVEESNLAQNIFLLRRILGEKKNEHRFIITIPGVGYRFAAYVTGSTSNLGVRSVPASADQKISCIAVLPMIAAGQNEMHPSLGVGLADGLITKLSNLKVVKVLPTATVLCFVEPAQKPRLGNDDLKVDALLNGLYQRDGDQLRVSVQLVLAGAGTMLWAEKFDAEVSSLFELQDAL